MNQELYDKDLSYYTTYWQKNIESIEEITIELKKLMLSLETKNLSENEISDSIESKLNLLLSIYSSYNSIKGREYIQKIKALYKRYILLEKKQSICLNTVNYMMQKIDEERDSSLNNFPGLVHEDLSYKTDSILKKCRSFNDSHYSNKWLCFSRNGSRFICKYNTMEIISVSDDNISITNGNKFVYYDKNTFPVTDLFRESVFCQNDVPSFVLLRDNSSFYAADSIEKKFLANRDILSEKIENYSFNNSIASGTIRLSGKKYICLK